MPPLDPIGCGLPHREPFVFVDRVTALDPGRSALCTRLFADGEPFFRGHFPGHPLVPGVILTEAAAQTAGIAAGGEGKRYLLSAIRQMKFLKPVPPGSLVEFSATLTASIGPLLQFEVTARLNGECVAEGVIVLNEA